jgi:hypothetical protein
MLKLMWCSKMVGSNIYEELMYQLQDVRFLGGFFSWENSAEILLKLFLT